MTATTPLVSAPAPAAQDFTALLGRIEQLLAKLAEAIDHPRLSPLLYRQRDLEILLGVDKRTLQRERSAGRFPAPDITFGRMPLWNAETIRAWIQNGGRV